MSLETGEKEIILGFVLENENNLKLSLKVHEVYDDVRKNILLKFFNGLEGRLHKQLSDEWEVLNEFKNDIYKKYNGLYITKKLWEEIYYIGLGAEKYGATDFWIGVYREEGSNSVLDGKLKQILDEKYKIGYATEAIWWQWLDQPYRDFNDIDLLVKMQFSDEVETGIFNLLVDLAKLSENIIDEALKKSK